MDKVYLNKVLSEAADVFLPSISVDCVIIGFHEGELKILLNKFTAHRVWMLPGGFVYKNENVDAAASRLLQDRTQLENVYLTQFHLFGDTDRINLEDNANVLNSNILNEKEKHWFVSRFVSVGYYALVNYSEVKVEAGEGEKVKWFNLNQIPELYIDHNKIIDKAISTLRMQLGYVPIGYQLLPEKFTMSELRVIYETILGKPIDRRNFQRRMVSSGLIIPLDELSKKWGIKATALFSFNKEKYEEAMKDGILML